MNESNTISASQKRLLPGLGRLKLALGIALVCFFGQSHAAQSVENDVRGISTDATSSFFSSPSGVSLRQATAIARKHTGGRVLSANSLERSGQVEHRVRMLVNGERVVTVTVDHEGQIKHKR